MGNKHRLQMQRRNIPAIQPKPIKVEDKPVNRLNQYTCRECGGVITTIDRDHGTTPMMLACRATDGCEGTMFSSGYQVDSNLVPEWEWFKPVKLPRDRQSREYIEMGGLDIRKIQP